jgi:hypothetical protein
MSKNDTRVGRAGTDGGIPAGAVGVIRRDQFSSRMRRQ